MELFRIESRIEILDAAGERAGREPGLRLQAALLRHAATAWGPRWKGPFEDEEAEHAEQDERAEASPADASLGPRQRGEREAFYEGLVVGSNSDAITVLAADPQDGAAQALRAALYRTADPAASFPPVIVTPNSETVRSGALQAGLQRLSDRAVPIHVVDLLGVEGSAMPEALRSVTAAIARDRGSAQPGRWVVVVDPLYERRIGPWSDDSFYGQVRIEHTQPIDRVSLEIAIEAGSIRLSARVLGSLYALYLGIARGGSTRSGVDTIAGDVSTLHSVVERALESAFETRPMESERRFSMHPAVEELSELVHAHERDAITKDAFIDRSLGILGDLRRELPEEATPVAEFLAAYADSHPFEPVPLPGDAGFVETIGRPPAVQRIVGSPRPAGPQAVT